MDAQEQKMAGMMQGMSASQAESLRLLTEQIAEKDRINKALEQRVVELSAQVAYLQRQLFGRKSEKLPLVDPNQLSLFDKPIDPEIGKAQEDATGQIEKETPEDRKQKRQNRKIPLRQRLTGGSGDRGTGGQTSFQGLSSK